MTAGTGHDESGLAGRGRRPDGGERGGRRLAWLEAAVHSRNERVRYGSVFMVTLGWMFALKR